MYKFTCVCTCNYTRVYMYTVYYGWMKIGNNIRRFISKGSDVFFINGALTMIGWL